MRCGFLIAKVWVIGIVLFASGGLARGQEEKAFKADPRAEAVVKGMLDYLANSKNAYTRIEFREELPPGEADDGDRMLLTIQRSRPNLLSVHYRDIDATLFLSSNGKTFGCYDSEKHAFATGGAPADLSDFAEFPGLPGDIVGETSVCLIAVAGPKVYDAWREEFALLEYLGEVQVGDKKCHHIRWVGDDVGTRADWWIETGKRPLPVSAVERIQIELFGGEFEIAFRATFQKWVVNGEVKPSVFEFKPPAGARRSQELLEATERAILPPPFQPMPAPDPQPAPAPPPPAQT